MYRCFLCPSLSFNFDFYYNFFNLFNSFIALVWFIWFSFYFFSYSFIICLSIFTVGCAFVTFLSLFFSPIFRENLLIFYKLVKINFKFLNFLENCYVTFNTANLIKRNMLIYMCVKYHGHKLQSNQFFIKKFTIKILKIRGLAWLYIKISIFTKGEQRATVQKLYPELQ